MLLGRCGTRASGAGVPLGAVIVLGLGSAWLAQRFSSAHPWSVFSWLGLVGCLALLFSLPWTALPIAALAMLVLLAVRRFVP